MLDFGERWRSVPSRRWWWSDLLWEGGGGGWSDQAHTHVAAWTLQHRKWKQGSLALANDGDSKVRDRDVMLPDFRGRHVSRFSVPKSSDEKIILPFVSAGVTWIDESKQQDRDNEVAESGDEGKDENNEIDDEEEEEEEEELVLSLPQFTTPQYINDRPDTALFTFEAGAARLARGDDQDQEDDEPELEDEECRWRLLIASNKKQADSDDED
eukprot:scaffold6403_cov128-Skeletonema_dohrnii-CCMP3373.AAC.17